MYSTVSMSLRFASGFGGSTMMLITVVFLSLEISEPNMISSSSTIFALCLIKLSSKETAFSIKGSTNKSSSTDLT